MKTNNPYVISDEVLAIRAQQGNQSAMGELYSRYYALVFNKCLSFTKNIDDASDLTQDVMIRVVEKIRSFNGDSKFSTWLYSVTFNYCTDHIRKARRKYFVPLENTHDIVDCSDQKLMEAVEIELKAEIAEQALSVIPEEDLQLLLMKYQLNKSIGELKSMYNLSTSAVKMRLKRAKSKAQIMYSLHATSVA
jgi:RNA polymerase sigma factor (sigma-70 family)